MCLSPDEMPSARLEEMVQFYREIGGDWYDRKAEQIEGILKQRAENGTYDEIPEVTPRHIHA